jgi:hypothetical protein
MPWSDDELQSIAAAEELEITTRRADGTLRIPVTVWVVRLGDGAYIRNVNGRGSAWFRGAQDRHGAHIQAGTVAKDVRLVESDVAADELDAAYRSSLLPAP